MNAHEFAVRRARHEFFELGTLSLTTVMELHSLGLNAGELEEEFANDTCGFAVP